MNLAFLYAGQGSQHAGMGQDLYEIYPLFRQILDDAPVDFDLKKLCFEGPEDQLSQTRYTQPCMVAFAAGVTALLKERGIVPQAAAGLSLGEYSALQAAGVFTPREAIALAAFRGKAMEEAAQGMESAMYAVLNLDRNTLEEVCRKASEKGPVYLANYNCPGQIVIGGGREGAEEACRLALEAGARRCLPLKVSGPFHTPLMAPAGKALEEHFAGLSFGEMAFPVYFNCLGRPKTAEETIPQLLVRQVQTSVYMEDTIRHMADAGIDTIVEVGPGKALSGFVKKTAPHIRTIPVETAQQLEDAVTLLKKEN
ncbi:ACP S-malonyltransferase [Intestinimonas sp. MSJ-38]|uniref:ACP S-malonyltransferase n=1 Tax=Intestinimonas sp. MSJ-38 TaxID=2841532 RepID=UPI001C11D867|nr:ACP S-malonyltransferase [Intestinimonas sp. MSJ-38]MBU5432949.1 ACP S-malonyltransferase [Intestinimonas sp. MSJ-38]